MLRERTQLERRYHGKVVAAREGIGHLRVPSHSTFPGLSRIIIPLMDDRILGRQGRFG
jgi:hypothetical protein